MYFIHELTILIFFYCLWLYSIFSITFSQEEQIHDFFLHLLRIRSLMVVVDTVTSENLIQSRTVRWLKVLHHSSSLFCIMNIMSLWPLVPCSPGDNGKIIIIMHAVDN